MNREPKGEKMDVKIQIWKEVSEEVVAVVGGSVQIRQKLVHSS